MRSARPCLQIIVTAAALLMAGCTTRYVRSDGSDVPLAEATLIRANDAVTAAYSLIGRARDAGLITQAEVDGYRPVIDTLNSTLDAAGAALRAGDEQGVQRWTDAARLALKRLEPLLTKAKR